MCLESLSKSLRNCTAFVSEVHLPCLENKAVPRRIGGGEFEARKDSPCKAMDLNTRMKKGIKLGVFVFLVADTRR